MNLGILFENVGLGFLIVTALFMIFFRDWKWSTVAGLVLSGVVVGDRLLSYYINDVAGLVFILCVIIVLIWLEYRKKPK